MTEIPQEAIDAGGEALYNGWEADYSADACRKVAKVAIAAALPFLRSQWEQELQNDEAIERVAASIFDCDYPDRWWDCPADAQGPYRVEARLAIRAALEVA